MIPRSFAAAPFDDGLGNCLRPMNPSVKTPMLYNATTYAATSSCEIANPRNSVALTHCPHCTYVRKTRFCSATPPARWSQAYSQHASHQQLTNPPANATQRMLAQNPRPAANNARLRNIRGADTVGRDSRIPELRITRRCVDQRFANPPTQKSALSIGNNPQPGSSLHQRYVSKLHWPRQEKS
jgi:hypothetical protein